MDVAICLGHQETTDHRKESSTMKTAFVSVLVLLAVISFPMLAVADSAAYEGLLTELRACREAVLAGVTTERCQEMLVRVKSMEKHIAVLFNKSVNQVESGHISRLQFNLEGFRFQCALFAEGVPDHGVMISFESVLKSFVAYRDWRKENPR
jgi:hypothetical protein